MFNQFHSPWCLTLLAVFTAASCAANGASIGPSELPRVESALSAQSSAGALAPKSPGEQHQQPPLRLDGVMVPTDAGQGASPASLRGADLLGFEAAITQSTQPAVNDSAKSTPQPLFDNVGEKLNPPARTLFARSQNLDVTQRVSVSQIMILDQTIEPGTRLKIMAFKALGSWYQTTDPDGPNHVALTYPETGVWTAVVPESARGLQRSLIFELASGSFTAGQTLEIRYSRLQGAKALDAPLTLPIALQLPNALSWQVLPGEQRSFVPGQATSLHISVDQQVEVNTRFDLNILPIDALGNVAATSIQSFDLLLNNRLLKEINLKDNRYVAAGLTVKTLGRHQFSARSPGGGLLSKTVTVWARPEPPQLIWTDFSERSLSELIAALPISVQDRQTAVSSRPNTTIEKQSASPPGRRTAQASSLPLISGVTGSVSQAGTNRVEDQTALTEPAPIPNSFNAPRIPSDPQLAAPADTFAPKALTNPVTQALPLENTSLARVKLTAGAPSTSEAPDTPDSMNQNGAEKATSAPATDHHQLATSDHEGNNIRPLTDINTAAEALLDNAPHGKAPMRSETAYTGTRTQNSRPKPAENGLSAVIQPIEAGGQSMILMVGDTTLRIAQPELTTDRRGRQFQLVEQLSGPSGHQWLSEYFATLGQTFGITSRRTSFQPRAHQQGPKTAIVVRPGQTWLEALASGQTFVTSGTKAGLSFLVNGTEFGRAPHQAQRTAEITVTSNERPLWARIFRNGELLKQLPFKSADANASVIEGLERQEQGQLFLYLESDSEPFAVGVSTPRNGREWLGQIRLQDLTMAESHADHLAALSGHQFSQSPDQQQLDFLTWTHGTGALMQLDLKEKKAATDSSASRKEPAFDLDDQPRANKGEPQPGPVVTLALAEGYEDLTYFDANRPPAATPSFNEQFDLETLRGQGIRRTLSVDGYLDQISLWYADAEPDSPIETTPPTHQITHLDRMGGRPGDYYTCQVLLRDGTSLYSSPIFVGGFDPR
jgi:hypothetical protein